MKKKEPTAKPLPFERKNREEKALQIRSVDTDPEYLLTAWNPDGGPLLAKTLMGLEEVLAAELESLGARNIAIRKRGVVFEGDQALLYAANYTCRTALRILAPIHAFTAINQKQFYAGVREYPWTRLFDARRTIAVDAVTRGELFTHSHYTALLTKDAIVDQFRDEKGVRPDVNTTAPDYRIHVHVSENQCQIMLDASGDSLHLRGYRRDTVAAPLSEVLAAGMILLTDWQGDSPFLDPMCGSGTLPVEATMIARRIPAQKHREKFGFQRWNDFNRKKWEAVRAEYDAHIRPLPQPVFASDKDPRARNATAINAMSAGLEEDIRISRVAFEKLSAPVPSGLLIMNPPYDERLPLEEAEAYYRAIGDQLKKRWTNWEAWVLSGNLDALKHLGLKTSRKIKLMNGPIECGFYRYLLR